MIFRLWFSGSLVHNDDGYELVRQYNQLIKQKQYLEQLSYCHDRIGGTKTPDTKQKMKKLIDRVDRL